MLKGVYSLQAVSLLTLHQCIFHDFEFVGVNRVSGG